MNKNNKKEASNSGNENKGIKNNVNTKNENINADVGKYQTCLLQIQVSLSLRLYNESMEVHQNYWF